jgi:hypothetical protein
MISIEKRFLFIHIPRTAGNSIQNILRHYSEDSIVKLADHHDGVEQFELCNSKYKITKHSTLSHYKSVLDANTYRSLFKFATIINPWERMISFYFLPQRGISEWNRNNFLYLVDRVQTLRHYICERSFLEKASVRLGVPGTIFKQKINADLDFLMRYEQLNHDFKVVCEKLDIPYSILPKRNNSAHKHYSKYYDDELKEIVRHKFIEEIEFGNYRFENG